MKLADALSKDTIAAVSTPTGRGAISVVRMSGPDVPAIGAEILGRLPEPRAASLVKLRDTEGTTLDQGVAIYFPAPNSFTGEHVLEFQGHGGPVVTESVLQRMLDCGARPARPGEFSERSFVNGRMDLAQAEAIADLIDAASSAAARAATASLEGEFSRVVSAIGADLDRLRTEAEAILDFPDEDADFLESLRFEERLLELAQLVQQLRDSADQGVLLRDGVRIAIVGPPNVGKSSLLNRLLRTERAIVTDIPGTTRDLIEELLLLGDVPVALVDTAGLRSTEDPVERVGIERAREQLAGADHVLLVLDDRGPGEEGEQFRAAWDIPAERMTEVRNKTDLSGAAIGVCDESGVVRISAREGAGLEALQTHLQKALGIAPTMSRFSARRRHLDALEMTAAAVARAIALTQRSAELELVAEELRSARQNLGEILGQDSTDELLGRIFSTFCIGK